MKYLIVILLLLVSCKTPKLEQMHQIAKEEGKHCYLIILPSKIAGKYCLIYKGNKLGNN